MLLQMLAILSMALFILVRTVRQNRSMIGNAVAGPPSESWLAGNLLQLFAKDGWNYYRGLTVKYGGAVKINAILGSEVLFVSDPLALYHVVVKDQHIFTESRDFIICNSMTFGPGLLSTEGDIHRRQRKMLNPVFSTTHMRNIISIVYPIVNKLRDAITYQLKDGEQEIDISYWLSRVALELIGQAGFGYSFDDLKPTNDSHNPYTKAVKQFGMVSQTLVMYRILIPIADRFFSRPTLRVLGKLLPNRNLHKLIDIVDVMDHTSHQVYEEKKRALEAGDKVVMEQLGAGNDIMSVLMRANSQASVGERLSDDELLAQINTFIFAGSDTTSSALSKVIYILAQHPDAQTRLREEVSEARATQGGDLDYDQLVGLPYLDAVCRETLRFDAPLPMLLREASADAVLPLGRPITAPDGNSQINDIALKKGTLLIVAIDAFNRNKDIWGPDADEWRPERWLEPLPKTATTEHMPGIFSHTMTFFGGNRACIGLKFSQLEMKAVLASLIEAFEFSLGEKAIDWNMVGIQVPTVRGQKDDMPRMPMKVSAVKRRV